MYVCPLFTKNRKKENESELFCVGVLRGRLLTDSWQELFDEILNPFVVLFLSFFSSRKLTARVHKGKKVRCQTHMANDGSVDCKKTHSLWAQSLTWPACARLRLFLHYDLLFMRPRWSFDTKAWSCIFYLKWVFGSHVSWNSAVPDPNVWCCILLFLHTLAIGFCMHSGTRMILSKNKQEVTKDLHKSDTGKTCVKTGRKEWQSLQTQNVRQSE